MRANDDSPVKSPSKAHRVLQRREIERKEADGVTPGEEVVMKQMGREVRRER